MLLLSPKGTGHGVRRPKFRLGVIALLIAAFVVGCTSPNSGSDTSWSGSVGGEVVTATVGSTVVTFPSDVAPKGTKAAVEIVDEAPAAPDGGQNLSSAIKISLTDVQLQPEAPIKISVAVTGPEGANLAEEYLMGGTLTSDDGTVDYVTGNYDASAGTLTAELDHLSVFSAWGIDLNGAMNEVRTAVMQGFGLEFLAPDCINDSVTIGSVKYEKPVQPAEAHLCLSKSGDDLVAKLYPAIVLPYQVTSSVSASAKTSPTELGLATTGMIGIARAIKLVDTADNATVFPGGMATFTFDGSPKSVELQFDQYPPLLLAAILAKVVDVLGIPFDPLSDLQCLADLNSTGAKAGKISGETVGSFTRTFFSCIGTASDLSQYGKIVVAILSSAPAFLVSSIIGIYTQWTGEDHNKIEITGASTTAGMLTSDGIGKYAFGADEAAVLSFLRERLGKPSVSGGVGGCEGAAGTWQSYAKFGGLSVRFEAAGESESAARTLASWTLDVAQNSDEADLLDPSIPYALSFEELQSKYPDGGGLEHMRAWHAGGVWIIPGSEMPDGKTMVQGGSLDWCT